jgi:SAM-dependent methyltransferase
MGETRGVQAKGHLLRDMTYFEYERRVAAEVVIPWLRARIELGGVLLGDVGAHQGGMLEAFRESALVRGGIGLELSEEVVKASPFVADERFRLEVADVMTIAPGTYEFDLVLLHDVLEHIPDYRGALTAIRGVLRPGGHVFISFPPYYSGFGGHQQLARGRARMVPFVHLLPAGLFFRLAEPGENEYMSRDGSFEDLVSVRRTRLSLGRAERAFADLGFRVVARELFLVRPEYRIRYGLRERGAGPLDRVPVLRELAVNGGFYLLQS